MAGRVLRVFNRRRRRGPRRSSLRERGGRGQVQAEAETYGQRHELGEGRHGDEGRARGRSASAPAIFELNRALLSTARRPSATERQADRRTPIGAGLHVAMVSYCIRQQARVLALGHVQ